MGEFQRKGAAWLLIDMDWLSLAYPNGEGGHPVRQQQLKQHRDDATVKV
jgi:hypothetical protein